MGGMKEIFKKEMARVFKDKKMLFSVFLLPVLIMIGIMTLVGNLASGMEDKIDQHVPVVYMQNEPESFSQFLEQNGLTYELNQIEDVKGRESAEDRILHGEADLLIEFPEGFDELTGSYVSGDRSCAGTKSRGERVHKGCMGPAEGKRCQAFIWQVRCAWTGD